MRKFGMRKGAWGASGALILAAMVVGGCATGVQQDEISTYYAMVYDIGHNAFEPIAAEHIESGDRVLIVNTGQGFAGLGYRFEYDFEPFSLQEYRDDHPFFTDYLESGMIRSILKSQGKVYERLNLAGYAADYVTRLREENYVFNTSLLEYDWWEEIRDEFKINKMLVYTVNKVVDSGFVYVGVQLGLKLLDVDAGGQVLWETIENVVSNDFPGSRMIELDRMHVDIPNDSINAFNAGLTERMEEEDLDGPIDVVLVKIDDIPIFGTYPITVEDFILEQQLGNSLTQLDSVNVLEKLYKRRYKTNWQLVNAVSYINPLRGGEYAEFESYYGTRYMLGYRILWEEQAGKIEEDIRTDIVSLNEKILGVFLKLIDTADYGRIVFCDFIPIAPQQDLDTNFLYRCYAQVAGLEKLVAEVEELGVLSQEEKIAIVNKRMEIMKDYLIRNSSEYEIMYALNSSGNEALILANYDKVYDLWGSIAEQKKVKGDIYYLMGAHLANSWFEDGLNYLLVSSGYSVVEKLESIYSRYLIKKRYGYDTGGENMFLSPLLLEEWGQNIKSFYDIDKIAYFLGLEKQVLDASFLTPDELVGEALAVELSQYYPILSYELDRFLFSMLDVRTGDYVYNRNLSVDNGGSE